jgi:protein-L-isoaspartate(D-aspartate) O-methyltransferase
MEEILELIDRLRIAGINVTDKIAEAMTENPIEHFSDHNHKAFYHDRPLVFLETEEGGIKTISAPHMIVTLLHHLELIKGQNVLLVGAKGGYLTALVSHLVGKNGRVIVIDPSKEVCTHVSSKLEDYQIISCLHTDLENIPPEIKDLELNRVLITGQIDSLPSWISEKLSENDFLIAPIGNQNHQELIKLENQNGTLMETSLGPVLFGPIDISKSIPRPISSMEMSNLIEQAIETLVEMDLINEKDKITFKMFIEEMQLLPETYKEIEINDRNHPLNKFVRDHGDHLYNILALIQMMTENRLASPGAPDITISSSHKDFIP